MRILVHDTDSPARKITLYLTRLEGQELADSLSAMLERGMPTHEHVNDQEYRHEVTVCLYDDQSVGTLDERSQQVISGSF
jgi:hypothetical protein